MNLIMRAAAFIIILLSIPVILHAQSFFDETILFRQNQIKQITAGPESPLWPEDSAYISYYQPSEEFLVNARVELLSGEKPFKMPTYAGTTKEFIRFARLHFTIKEKKYTLTAYKNLSIPRPLASLHTTMFIPFMDETNDEETYGGGRYLDLSIAKDTKEISLDFNKTYNPYCAYSDGYRCPVPPQENYLNTKISAGEKQYKGTKRSRNIKRESANVSFLDSAEVNKIMEGDTTKLMRVIQTTIPEEMEILRKTSTDIDPADPALATLASRMFLSVRDPSRPGIGIAAPQVGINRNLIWVQRLDKENQPFELYLNPEITWRSELLIKGQEGCLSIPDVRGDVNRHYAVRVSYMTREGEQKDEIVEGLVSVIFQHETDHLKGQLFPDVIDNQSDQWPVSSETKLFFNKKPYSRQTSR